MGRDSRRVKPGLKEGQAGGFVRFTRAEFGAELGAELRGNESMLNDRTVADNES